MHFSSHTDFSDYDEVLKAVFVGVVLTATSVSITVETLREMGKLKMEKSERQPWRSLLSMISSVLSYSQS